MFVTANNVSNQTGATLTDVVAQRESSGSPKPYVLVTGLLLSAVAIWAVFGNLLVFLAMSKYRSLRTISNYLILNMALSDFLLAVTVLPFSISNDLLEFWIFGATVCKTWLAIDVLYCTASIWNIVAVAFDRFTATTFPLWYRERRSHVMAMVYITVVWTWSTLISVPPMMTNEQFNSTYVYEQHTGRHQCILYNQIEYVVFSSLGSFIVPMVALAVLYAKIFAVLHAQSRRFAHNHRTTRSSGASEQSLRAGSRCTVCQAEAGAAIDAKEPMLAKNGSSPPRSKHKRAKKGSRWAGLSRNVDAGSVESVLTCDSSAELKEAQARKANGNGSGGGSGNGEVTACSSPAAPAARNTRRNSLKRFAKRENEATKRVTVVVGLFVVSWMPFMIMYMYRGFTGHDVNEHLQKLIIWLGYANSALNPCLYIWQNREFRNAFVSILRSPKRVCH